MTPRSFDDDLTRNDCRDCNRARRDRDAFDEMQKRLDFSATISILILVSTAAICAAAIYTILYTLGYILFR